MRRLSIALSGLALLVGCSVPPPPTSPAPTAPPPVSAPLVTGLPTGAAVDALAALPVKDQAPMTGYSRDQFGPAWSDVDHNGCNTRDDILRRDLIEVSTAPQASCVVLTGTLHDPYTGNTIHFVRGPDSDHVQIDHVVSLANAWQTGAQQFDAATRERFANDPVELLAVDGPTNEQKGDSDIASWQPPDQRYWCPFAARQIQVKTIYHLWVTRPEHDMMARILATCPGQELPQF